MNKEEFVKLLENAKEDENGNLYFLDKILANDEDNEAHRVYFGTITTICEDLIEVHSSEFDGYQEVYDIHFYIQNHLIKLIRSNFQYKNFVSLSYCINFRCLILLLQYQIYV